MSRHTKYKSERLSWSLRSDVEFYKELLHEYTIRGKAYGKNGIKSYRDYKLYASLARKVFEISSIFSNTIESLIISINSPQGKPNFSEVFDALYKGVRQWNQFQKDYKAIQYGDKKIKRIFEEETFRWIAGSIAYAVSNAWYERVYKLKKEGLENTGDYRQAVAEYRRWKGFMAKTQLFESDKPILMKRTFWRAWDWIPVPYKTDSMVKIENEVKSSEEKWSLYISRYESFLDDAIYSNKKDELLAKAEDALREAKTWKVRYDEWQSRLETPLETEVRRAVEAAEEAQLEWKRLIALHGGTSQKALTAKKEYKRLERIAKFKEKRLEREREKRYLFENEEVDRKTYETVDYNSFYPSYPKKN